MARRSRRSDSTDFAVRVEPLDEIQFDNEEICIPIMVVLRRRGAEVPTKKMPGVACYNLKFLDYRFIPPKRKAFFDIGLAFKMEKGWTIQIHNRLGLSLIWKYCYSWNPENYWQWLPQKCQNLSAKQKWQRELHGEKKGQNCTDVPSVHLFYWLQCGNY